MKWKFWKRNNPIRVVAEITQEAVPLSTLIRWYCYDLEIEDVNGLVKEFDLMPVSEEGEDFEVNTSNDRMEAVYPLFPFIDMMAAINAKAISTIQLQDFKEEGLISDEVDPEIMESMYRQISFAALVSAFSSAIELGLVNKNYGFMSIQEGE